MAKIQVGSRWYTRGRMTFAEVRSIFAICKFFVTKTKKMSIFVRNFVLSIWVEVL